MRVMKTNKRKLAVPGRDRQRGFTLLELMVTITILALVLSFGVPSFQQVMADSRRTSDVNELLLSLNLARSEALKRNQHVSICKSADGAACGDVATSWNDGWIVFVNNGSANVDTVNVGEEILLVKPALSRNAVLTPDAGVADFAAFRPSGRINTSGGFVLCDGRSAEHARGVFISPTGRPTSAKERPDGSDLVCP